MLPTISTAMRVPATPAIEAKRISVFYEVREEDVLGKGGFSQVVRAKHIATGEMRALKVIQRKILTGKNANMVTHEKEILRRTNHPCILKLYETIQTPHHVFLALELMSEDLFELVIRHKRLKEPIVRKIMHQVLSGVAYLHEQSITHRDIKPENILINTYTIGEVGSSPSPPPTNINDIDPDCIDVVVKLADFGLSKLVLERDVWNTPCGTSYYLAPEILHGIEEQGATPLCTTQQLIKRVDIWSCGVVMYVQLCGRPPFAVQSVQTSEERQQLLRRIDRRGALREELQEYRFISNEAKELLCLMLEREAERRLTAEQALAHPFFTAHGFPRTIPGSLLFPPIVAEKPVAAPLSEKERVKPKRTLLKSLQSIFVHSAEHSQWLDDLDALQKKKLQEEDPEGDRTAYISAIERKNAKPVKPATMNPKFKVGPRARP